MKRRHRAEREAGISKLPAPILQHILSFLSQEEAVRTCVVSKSWRYLGSTRPKFSLNEIYFGEDEEKFRNVLDKSLQVYYDQKLCIDAFDVYVSTVDPEFVSLLEKWVPIIIQDLGVKKFHLSLANLVHSAYFDLPAVVFESQSLQELYLQRCYLSQINCVGNGNHLKTLDLTYVNVDDEETFAKVLSSCPLIERISLHRCKGFRTIKMHNHHNLKSFDINHYYHNGSIEIHLPSSIGRIIIYRCPNWYHHRNYFPGLTCLELSRVPLSHEWFNSFPRNFPCLEELKLFQCNGFDELKLSSPSVKKLHITMDESTTNATFDTPSIKEFFFNANISQSISLTATTSHEWNSDMNVSLNQLDASQWFLKLSELVAAFSQSRINSLVLYHSSDIEHPPDILICCGGSKKPVAIERLSLNLSGVNNDFFLSDLVIGLFRFVRPREIEQFWKDEFLCRTLQMGRWEEDGRMRSFYGNRILSKLACKCLIVLRNGILFRGQ